MTPQPATRAITANPLRAIRHADGLHKRVVDTRRKGACEYRRHDKHKGQAWA